MIINICPNTSAELLDPRRSRRPALAEPRKVPAQGVARCAATRARQLRPRAQLDRSGRARCLRPHRPPFTPARRLLSSLPTSPTPSSGLSERLWRVSAASFALSSARRHAADSNDIPDDGARQGGGASAASGHQRPALRGATLRADAAGDRRVTGARGPRRGRCSLRACGGAAHGVRAPCRACRRRARASARALRSASAPRARVLGVVGTEDVRRAVVVGRRACARGPR